jgi:hypothetical protein
VGGELSGPRDVELTLQVDFETNPGADGDDAIRTIVWKESSGMLEPEPNVITITPLDLALDQYESPVDFSGGVQWSVTLYQVNLCLDERYWIEVQRIRMAQDDLANSAVVESKIATLGHGAPAGSQPLYAVAFDGNPTCEGTLAALSLTPLSHLPLITPPYVADLLTYEELLLVRELTN